MAKRGALEAYIDLKDRSARGFQQFNRNVDKSTRGVGTMNKRMVAMDAAMFRDLIQALGASSRSDD